RWRQSPAASPASGSRPRTDFRRDMNAAVDRVTTAVRWLPAYVGVGSNLSDPAAQVRRALAALGGLPGTKLIASSPLYRTQPFGDVVQPAFVNAVAGLLTQRTPDELLTDLR